MTEGLSTRCVHAGEVADAHGSPPTPLYNTTTFKFASPADLLDVVDGRKSGSLYTRYGLNPTLFSLEQKLAALEGAEMAWAFCSGMAAEAALFLTHGRKGIVCLGDAYGGTLELLSAQLPLLGIPTHLLVGSDLGRLDAILAEGVGLVFFETPTNPTLEVFDIPAIAKVSHAHGALVAVDNTFASPVNQQPLALGADIVIHSATKFLDGQGRVLGGAVLGKREVVYEGVLGFLRTAGPTLSAFNAWVILKGLETLKIRVDAQSAAALELARWLESQPSIARVYYPGLPSHPQHALAMRQQKSGGAIVSFEVKGGKDVAWRIVDATKLISITANLGDTKTTITHPASTTHGRISPEARAAAGIGDGLLRVAVGLENIEDIKADLARGLL